MENQKAVEVVAQEFFMVEDIWNEKDKQIPINPSKIYDPQKFWDGYGERFYKEHSKREHFQNGVNLNNPVAWLIFKMKALGISTVLEAGCGFGRLAPFIIDAEAAKEYFGVDFSEKILECHKKYIPSEGEKAYKFIDHVHFKKASAKHMPFSNASMDCVICSELLQHMSRTKADHTLREMKRISRKYVIAIERFVFEGERPQPHMWSHNTVALASNMGLKVIESKVIGNGLIATICEV